MKEIDLIIVISFIVVVLIATLVYLCSKDSHNPFK